MFVILAYDIRQKRVTKVRKIVRQYLIPVQRSVFHGFITQKQYNRMKTELLKTVNTDEDAVLVYILTGTAGLQTEELGISTLREWDIL